MERGRPPSRITDPEQAPAFLHALRHELVQPLHTLGLLLDLLPATGDAEAMAIWSDRSVRSLENLKHMLKVLGDVAKLDLLPPVSSSHPTSVGCLFAGISVRHQPLLDATASSLRVVASRHMVLADPELLRLGFDALVDNALRYGAGKPILIGARRRGNRLLVAVWDRGPGLELDEAVWLQEDFRRGDDARAEQFGGAGLGLGLGLARRVAYLLGGELWFDTRSGHGACAGILLDLAEG